MRNEKTLRTAVLVLLGSLCTSVGHTAQWDLGENKIGVGGLDQDWGVDEPRYEGTRWILDGQYTLLRRPGDISNTNDCCTQTARKEHLAAVVSTHLQWDPDESDLEFYKIGVTGFATQWEPEQDPAKKWQVTRDQLAWGSVLYSVDDPLGIDSYIELAVARADRTWDYKWSQESSFKVTFGIQGSLGFAWAESTESDYSDVSNPYAGTSMYLALVHDKFGTLYTDDRVNAGFTLSSPSAGDATSREARIRFGYFLKFYRCMALDVFLEKRSFNFADSDEPDLYTKSKRVGGEVSCRFGKS